MIPPPILRHLLPLAAALALTGVARADNLERTTTGRDVSVTISSPFSSLPPGGAVPFRVAIRNDGSSAGTWHCTFNATANSSNGSSEFAQDFTVAPHASGSFDLVVPLPLMVESYENLNVRISGPGFPALGAFFAEFYTNYSGSGPPFTLIGKGVLGVSGTGPLEHSFASEKASSSSGTPPEMSRINQVDPALLPTDWRAYAGVGSILLSNDDWLALNPAQQGAIRDYVALGGHLKLLAPEAVQGEPYPSAQEEKLSLRGSNGFGKIKLTAGVGSPPTPELLRTTLESDVAPAPLAVDGGFATWDLRKLAGTIAVSSVFILTFVAIFGTLVGPVNLFVFSREKNRFRLFWTTPLISLVASLLLVAGILLTDGIGGRGQQMVAIFSLPEANREAIVQEQVARTAVLFSNRWRNEQDYLIMPISTQVMNGAMLHQGPFAYRGSRSNIESADSYVQEGNEMSGNWFRSRSISGQYLQAVRPTRSALTVFNANAAPERGGAPILLSSFPVELTEVQMMDAQGRYWKCEHLTPGRKQPCVSCSVSEHVKFWQVACDNAGGKLRPLLANAARKSGYFYATGTPGPDETLNTLGEIRWSVVNGIYLGPWVAAPASEDK